MGLNFPEIPGALDLKRMDLVPAVVAGGATLLLVAVLLTRRKRGPIAALLAFLLRGISFAVLALLLLDPVERTEERHPGSLLLAVDMSRSVDAGARSEAWDALRNRATGDPPPTAVGFGAYARSLDPAAPVPSGPAADDLISDPGPAVDALLLREDAGGGAARLVVATDGAVALVDESLPVASELSPLLLALGAGEGMRVQAVGLELTHPPVPGQPVRFAWRGTASAAGDAVLVAHVNGQQVRRVRVSIEPGAVEIPVTTPPLPPGRHVIAVRVDADGDDTLDNAAVTEVRVEGPPTVTLVADAERPLVLSALRAQNLDVEHVAPAALLADPVILAGAGVIVLDRVAASTLSEPGLLRALTQKVKRGAGLLYLPRENVGEMYDVRAKPFLDLLPLLGQPPPPQPEEERPPKSPDSSPGLKPPDPEKPHKREKRKAPSLGLLLLVDSSSSMKGSKLRLAKEAAIAAAEVLHPKDLVGLVQFNNAPSLVLDLTPAGDKAEIIDRVSRLKASGGTRFGPALEYALEIFEAQDLAIRHVILLSDGESRPFRAKPLVSGMAEKGITVSTVGCGGGFDEVMLSDIAQWGAGRFHPAFNANEIPQIFTIEAERVIKATGARHRRDAQAKTSPDPPKPPPDPPVNPPKPPEKKPEQEPEQESHAIPFRLGLPAPYLGGIGPHDVPGLLGLHATRARPGAWVSLETEDEKAPVLAHRALGYGRVAAFALPLEGGWAAHVIGWNDYQTLLSQLVRFLHADASPRRFHVNVHPRGRSVLATVLDREMRTLPDGLEVAVVDERGRVPEANVDRVEDDTWRIRLDPRDGAAALVVRVVSTDGSEPIGGSDVGLAVVPPPPEVAERGLDLEGLEAWADALGGRVVSGVPVRLDVPQRVIVREHPWGAVLLPWLLILLGIDLMLRRLWPGRLE